MCNANVYLQLTCVFIIKYIWFINWLIIKQTLFLDLVFH